MVIAAGDLVPGGISATHAIGHGKRATRAIDGELRGEVYEPRVRSEIAVCPDNAITKDGPGRGFSFKYDYCKGCGLCENECPCGAIRMVPEA